MKTISLIILFVIGAYVNLSAAKLALTGTWKYSVDYSSRTVSITGGGIENKEAGSKTGTIKIKLYLTKEKYPGGTISGYVLGESKFEQLSAGDKYTGIDRTLDFKTEPLPGDYHVTLVLLEYTSDGYIIKDHRELEYLQAFTNSGSGARAQALEQDHLTLGKDQNKTVTKTFLETCYECHGSGRCTVCSGTGRNGNIGKPQACEVCGGTGVCTRCKGTRLAR